MSARSDDHAEYRRQMQEVAWEYQDFIVDLCWDSLGLAVVQYCSGKYQKAVGESRTGVEVKHDQRFAETGNLFIELGEKACPRPGEYAPSGIERDDNTWLYVIGDYDTVFVFAKSLLRLLATRDCYKKRESARGTSFGFLLPRADAEKYAATVLYPNAKQEHTLSAGSNAWS